MNSSDRENEGKDEIWKIKFLSSEKKKNSPLFRESDHIVNRNKGAFVEKSTFEHLKVNVKEIFL